MIKQLAVQLRERIKIPISDVTSKLTHSIEKKKQIIAQKRNLL